MIEDIDMNWYKHSAVERFSIDGGTFYVLHNGITILVTLEKPLVVIKGESVITKTSKITGKVVKTEKDAFELLKNNGFDGILKFSDKNIIVFYTNSISPITSQNQFHIQSLPEHLELLA